MRKLFVALFVLALLALNWAALHDILKGEPDVWMEWSIVALSVLLLVVYSIRRIRQLA
jgi:hypothetical protein